ncbi:MAG: carboxypeptidase M32 [Phycisphaerales bacterium]|nr:carboxypeptidase M32 [Phycisphaerales bacterium]
MATTAPAHESTTSTHPAYQGLLERIREAQLIGSSAAILGWDQETMMPSGGVEYRGAQLAMLSRLAHEAFTSEATGEALSACEAIAELTGDPNAPEAVNIREIRREYDRKTCLPASLVEEEAALSSRAMHKWADARKAADFSMFLPELEEVVALMKRKAECYGWPEGGEPWDALAEDYEPGCTAAEVETVFTPLRKDLQALLDDLMGSSTTPSNAFNEVKVPIEKQKTFVRDVATQFGFDFDRGRLDESTHPFCSGSHCNDVRMTTRFHENNVNDALGSTMHETGHGLYEQGLLASHIGTPMGTSVSLGIHESQSRMWENQVGRSEAFWRWCHPRMKDILGDCVSSLSFEDVYGGANIVRPDFIRVEADEATYNMHIMIRFEMERALMRGDLAVADIPDAWNTKYRDYLGIDVPNDAKGCLQDVHWSMCSLGYFPTYTLGNLYCAQFFEKAMADMPDLHDQFARGEFSGLLSWLRTNIHEHGQRYRAGDLCEVVTGRPLESAPLVKHLNDKLRPLYGV